MKTIGLLGGMSWQSTVSYYQAINQGIAKALGGLHSAKIAMVSVDFDPIARLQSADDWGSMATMLSKSAQQIEQAGADCLLIATNTMHLVADHVQASIDIPLLHIADATAVALEQDGINQVALLGTAFTMQKPFYKDRLRVNFGISTLVPDAHGQQIVHDVIYNELCQGVVAESSKQAYLEVVSGLQLRGAQGLVLGCTEIGLLLQQRDVAIPVYDTAALHAQAAVEFALA